MGQMYQPKQVAGRLQVAVRTLRRWMRDGLIDYQIVGKKLIRFTEEDVQRFLARGRPTQAA